MQRYFFNCKVIINCFLLINLKSNEVFKTSPQTITTILTTRTENKARISCGREVLFQSKLQSYKEWHYFCSLTSTYSLQNIQGIGQ